MSRKTTVNLRNESNVCTYMYSDLIPTSFTKKYNNKINQCAINKKRFEIDENNLNWQ